jgi:hypothetical protein
MRGTVPISTSTGGHMAEKTSEPNSIGPVPVLAVILFVVTYFISANNEPFQGSRPQASGSQPVTVQDVEARLWQDPFGAIAADKTKTSKKPQPKDFDKVIGVLVPGSPYAESEEFRRQIRYAVLSGLGVEGYIPKDAEHIGYFNRLYENHEGDDRFLTRIDIPYEILLAPPKDEKPRSGNILLLWINEEVVGKEYKPLQRLLHIREAFREKPMTFLGPTASTTLKMMIDETNGSENTCGIDPKKNFEEITLYNYWATADETQLMPPNCDYDKLDKYFNNSKMTYIRTISNDATVASVLKEELENRGIHLPSQDRIILVSEWDTLYGRELPNSVMRAFGVDPKACLEQREPNPKCASFVKFSYLRGLDGQLAANRDAQTDEPGTARTNQQQQTLEDRLRSLSRPSLFIEPPYGNAQYDYIRRLEIDINQHLRDVGHIAVGILGNDVYDKLTALQQFRRVFPQAVFFTTEMHARLFDPREIEWTRNLLVASGFGLSLPRELRPSIPPFRTDSQTSVFLTVRLVLSDWARKGETIAPAYPAWVNYPALFQIPYHGFSPYPLVTDNSPQLLRGYAQDGGRDKLRTECLDELLGLMRKCLVTHELEEASYPKWSDGSRIAGALLIGMIFLLAGLAASPGLRAELFDNGGKKDTGKSQGASAKPSSNKKEEAEHSDDDKAEAVRNKRRRAYALLLYAMAIPALVALPWDAPLAAFAMAAAAIAGLGYQIVKDDEARIRFLRRVWPIPALFLLGALYSFAWPNIADFLTEYGRGEPITFTGISLWPSLALRGIALTLAILFILSAVRRWRNARKDIAEKIGLKDDPKTHVQIEMEKLVDQMLEKNRRWSQKWLDRFLYRPDPFNLFDPKTLPIILRDLKTKLNADSYPAAINLFWALYSDIERRGVGRSRIGFATLFLLLFEGVLCLTLGNPQPSMRGETIYWFNILLSVVEAASTWWLIFLVVDFTLLSRIVAQKISEIEPNWPDDLRKQQPPNLPPDQANLWVSLQFVGQLTESVDTLVKYPFIVLTLRVLAQSSWFDDFPPNWPFLIMTALGFIILIACAYTLRKMAEEHRQTNAEHVKNWLLEAKGGSPEFGPPGQLELLLHWIEKFDTGAFKPLSRQPVVRALLWPLGGIGGAALLQYLTIPT